MEVSFGLPIPLHLLCAFFFSYKTRRLRARACPTACDIMILVYDSDATTGALTPVSSSNSIEDILNNEDADVPADAWKLELQNRVEQIVNLKRSSTDGRAESLNVYAHILMARYAKEDIESRVSELLPSILRSIKSETTERESLTALRGMLSHLPPHCLHAARLTHLSSERNHHHLGLRRHLR